MIKKWFTKKTLAEYVWDEYSIFWTLEDVNRLIRKKLLKFRRLGTNILFDRKEIEDYFEEQRRRNQRTIDFHVKRRRTYRSP